MKKQTIIALAVIGILLVATIGVTFAYFASSSQNDDAGINAETEELGSILLDGTKVFTSYDLLPGQMGVQEFTIEKNSDTGNGIYEIDLEATVPEEFRSDIEILLYKTTDPVSNKVTVNVADPTLEDEMIYQEDSLNITGSPELVYQGTLTENPQIILEQADFDVTTLEKTTYYLVYHYKNNGNQDNQQGKTFTGTITVRLINEKTTFADAILACDGTATECIIQNASLSTEQLAYDGTVDNNLRYIGADPNNYVEFGERYPEGTVKGKWEEIDMPVTSVEECNNMAEMFVCDNYTDLGFSSIEECNTNLPLMLEEYYNVSDKEEFKSTYCVVQEDLSNQPILWRIIGVFNNIDNGSGTKETRLKIIRDEPYSTGMAWDTDNINDWTTASLQEELNTTYLNSIQSPYKEMISNAKWNLGGSSANNDITTSMFYERERGAEVYSGRPTEWTGQIGLMYPSDYGYATSGGSTTDRASCLATELYNWDSVSDCYNNDWLYDSSNYQWTLTPNSDTSHYVFSLLSHVRRYNARDTSTAVSPVLYLSSNVKISRGDGSENSPFELSGN